MPGEIRTETRDVGTRGPGDQGTTMREVGKGLGGRGSSEVYVETYQARPAGGEARNRLQRLRCRRETHLPVLDHELGTQYKVGNNNGPRVLQSQSSTRALCCIYVV